MHAETEYERLPIEHQAQVIKTIQRWQKSPRFGEGLYDALRELPFKVVLCGWESLQLGETAHELNTPLYQRLAGK